MMMDHVRIATGAIIGLDHHFSGKIGVNWLLRWVPRIRCSPESALRFGPELVGRSLHNRLKRSHRTKGQGRHLCASAVCHMPPPPPSRVVRHSRYQVNSPGFITTIAGSRSMGYSGDNGPATAAKLAGPLGVAVASWGDVYIADTSNYCVRKVRKNRGT